MTNVRAPRRRARTWVIVLVVVAVIGVGGWFGGEAIARSVVSGIVKEQLGAALGLPEGHPMEVTIEGTMIPQLVAGSFREVHVASEDVQIGEVAGDLVGSAHGMRFDGTADGMEATLSLTAEQLLALLPTDRVAIDALVFEAPAVRLASSFEVWSLPVDVELLLTPAAKDGDLTLTPEGFTIGTVEMTAQDIHGQFGGIADPLLNPWQVCVADQLPAGVTLTAVVVSGDRLRASADIDGAIAADPTLQSIGTCS